MSRPLGLQSGVVRLVPYDAAWPELFAAESHRIRAALTQADATNAAIEHIGSTSVPGLIAKPVLDILVGYPRGAGLAPYIAGLESVGYVHRGEQGIAGREFFRRGRPRAYHVHLVVTDGAIWREYLLFRDHLRAKPEALEEYARLKRALAARFPRDRESYIEGKTRFVRRIVG